MDKEKIKVGGIYVGIAFAVAIGIIGTAIVLAFAGGVMEYGDKEEHGSAPVIFLVVPISMFLVFFGIVVAVLHTISLRYTTKKQKSDSSALEEIKSDISEIKKILKEVE